MSAGSGDGATGAAGEPLFIPVICGSIRKNRRSLRPVELIAARVAAAGHRTQVVDLRELALPMYDEEPESEAHPGVVQLRAVLDESDASIWHSPEYNHSFTGAVKNART